MSLMRRVMTEILVAGVAACSSAGTEPVGAPPPGPFTTDAVVYTATKVRDGQYTLRVVARYTNSTSGTLYLARCYPSSPTPIYSVQLLTPGNKDGAAWNPGWGCVGHNQQIVVQPSQTRVDTLELYAPNALDGITHVPYGAFEGTVRLGYGVLTCPGELPCGSTPIPDSMRFSNEFTIRLPR